MRRGPLNKVPLVDLKAQYETIRDEIDAAIHRVIDHTGFILGEEVESFERAFAEYVGAAGTVGVASGTAALFLALRSLDIGTGDEVITTAHTFMATAEAISQTGARPVFVDIEPETYNINPALVEAAITPRTKAIVPVHLYGQPANMDPLMDLARKYHLWVIEDAAQAHGAEYAGKRCGTLGHLACFSFYPGKNLGAYGDGGAVTGMDTELLQRVRKLRDHGRITKYEHDEIGFGERLDALQAAVLSVKLRHLDEWTAARRRWARVYSEQLSGLPLGLPVEVRGSKHVYHLYVIRVPSGRDELLRHLKDQGVGCGIHYPIPLHRQPAYARQGYGSLSLQHAEKAALEVLTLPMYPELTEAAVTGIARAIGEWMSWQ